MFWHAIDIVFPGDGSREKLLDYHKWSIDSLGIPGNLLPVVLLLFTTARQTSCTSNTQTQVPVKHLWDGCTCQTSVRWLFREENAPAFSKKKKNWAEIQFVFCWESLVKKKKEKSWFGISCEHVLWMLEFLFRLILPSQIATERELA